MLKRNFIAHLKFRALKRADVVQHEVPESECAGFEYARTAHLVDDIFITNKTRVKASSDTMMIVGTKSTCVNYSPQNERTNIHDMIRIELIVLHTLHTMQAVTQGVNGFVFGETRTFSSDDIHEIIKMFYRLNEMEQNEQMRHSMFDKLQF